MKKKEKKKACYTPLVTRYLELKSNHLTLLTISHIKYMLLFMNSKYIHLYIFIEQ